MTVRITYRPLVSVSRIKIIIDFETIGWYKPEMPINTDRIREARKAAKLTQEKAAKRSEMTVAYWNAIECGRQDSDGISITLLERIAKALKIDPAELLKRV